MFLGEIESYHFPPFFKPSNPTHNSPHHFQADSFP